MGTFSYRAVTPDGASETGQITAANQDAAVAQLQARNLFPVAVDVDGAAPARQISKGSAGLPSDPLTQRVEILRLMVPLLGASIPVDRALGFGADMSAKPRTKAAFIALREAVGTGQPLSAAMARPGLPFAPMDIALAAAGEETGDIAGALTRARQSAEAALALRVRVRSALLYPSLLVGVAALVFIFLAWGVLPRFENMFVQMGAAAPLQLTIAVGLVQIAAAGLGAAVLAGLAAVLSGSTRALLNHLPLFGPALKTMDMAQLVQTLGAMLSAGVKGREAISLAGTGAQVSGHQAAFSRAAEAVEKGTSLPDALAQEPLIPALAPELARLGQETGRLGPALVEAAAILMSEAQSRLDRATTLLGPVVTLILAVLIGGVLYAMITAIMTLYDGILA